MLNFEPEEQIAGTHSLRRMLDILRVVGHYHASGLRMTDVSALTGIKRSTAYRMLVCLVEENFLEFDSAKKRYSLGREVMQLGLAVERKPPLVRDFRPLMLRLTRMTSGAAFLLVAQGDEAIYLHRELGEISPREFARSNSGGRTLLGFSAGGLALLARYTDDAIEAHFVRNRDAYSSVGITRERLWSQIRMARNRGFSEVGDWVKTGFTGVGAAVSNIPHTAVSVGRYGMRLDVEFRSRMSQVLLQTLEQGQLQ